MRPSEARFGTIGASAACSRGRAHPRAPSSTAREPMADSWSGGSPRTLQGAIFCGFRPQVRATHDPWVPGSSPGGPTSPSRRRRPLLAPRGRAVARWALRVPSRRGDESGEVLRGSARSWPCSRTRGGAGSVPQLPSPMRLDSGKSGWSRSVGGGVEDWPSGSRPTSGPGSRQRPHRRAHAGASQPGLGRRRRLIGGATAQQAGQE